MKNQRILIRIAAVASFLLFALLSGCATAPQSDDEIVAERSQARWDAVLARDYETAYSFYSPGFRSTRSVADLEIKLRLQRIRWTNAKYRDHSCTGDSCTVRVDLTYKVSSPVPGVDSWNGFDLIEEQWVRTGGEWWYIPPKN